ncbi:DUF4406 domain-containing protein [Sulfobacillus sp. hq2]|uniref:DUF4406 domain-containing protein n=1 Tax=Sulfobacillus TaxID=28033 RepID=UPI000CD284EB|nr:DUF4406 domain-containing protein [Sulfobacillus sp. hq2]POB12318.1 hypothetical protein CO251_00175 [Sulfobacillus sp. hq2]
MRLYLAGPMTGYPDYNYPAFFAAADALRHAGYTILNPADIGLHPTWTWADYMRVGLDTLTTHAEAVAVLPGWEASRGARLEVRLARRLGLRVHTVFTWHALTPLFIPRRFTWSASAASVARILDSQ